MGKTESVDRLGVIADGTDGSSAGKLVNQAGLDNIGILKFINQNMGKALPVMLFDFRMLFKELQPTQQKIVKVKSVGFFFFCS